MSSRASQLHQETKNLCLRFFFSKLWRGKKKQWDLNTLMILKSRSAAFFIVMHLDTTKTKPGNMGEILQNFVCSTPAHTNSWVSNLFLLNIWKLKPLFVYYKSTYKLPVDKTQHASEITCTLLLLHSSCKTACVELSPFKPNTRHKRNFFRILCSLPIKQLRNNCELTLIIIFYYCTSMMAQEKRP